MTPDEILKKLQDAKPSWIKDGLGIRGAPVQLTSKQTHPTDPNSLRHIIPGPTEQLGAPAQATTQQTLEQTTPGNEEYSFQLTLDSIDTEAFTIDIHVGYGEINDTPPDGMTGADDYILTIPGSATGTEVYAVVTYDPMTLAITSRSLAFAFSVPDNTSGTLYIPIGFIDIDYDSGTGAIKDVFPHNRQCGDIQIGFVYGAVNGQPGLFFLHQYSDPIGLTP